MSGWERAKILRRIAELIRSEQERFAILESWDNGKPISESKWAAVAAADVFDFYAGWADKFHGEQIPLKNNHLDILIHEPRGVIGCITPWNFPTTQPTFKAVPAVAMGNSVVHKPAEQASLPAVLLAQLCLDAGLPPGVWNVVTGLGEEAGAALVDHAGIDALSFTGSSEVGREIMSKCGRRLLPVSLECGGKSAMIVFSDADLEKALPAAVTGAFYNQGQVCNAACRILVEESIAEEFTTRFVDLVNKIQVGNPFEPRTTLGPVISEEQLAKDLSYIDIGGREGATCVTGGKRADRAGYFVEPTVFTNVLPTMRIAQEEIFGPVTAIMAFRDEADAVKLANSTAYGLATGVWTSNLGRALRMIRSVQSGTVWVNAFGPFDIAAPWTGYKQSGIGTEWGKEMLRFVTRPKNVWIANS
jgi:aldehyde dehydrogenase (NAD+)